MGRQAAPLGRYRSAIPSGHRSAHGNWLATMNPHAALVYEVDLRQFTEWLTAGGIAPEAVTPKVITV